jgi:hypothetical protein
MRGYFPYLSLLCCVMVVGCAPAYGAHPFFGFLGDVLKEAPRFSLFSKDHRRFTVNYHCEQCYNCKIKEEEEKKDNGR